MALVGNVGAITSSLPGWLHATATTRSLNAVRNACTRNRHEEQAMKHRNNASEPTWAEIAPLVDRAIEELPEDLRAPLVLHYLQRRSQSEIAADLGVNQATVSRRLEKGVAELRERLRSAGVLASVGLLTTLLSTSAAQAAPAALLTALGKMAMAGVGKTAVTTAPVPGAPIGGASVPTSGTLGTLQAKIVAVAAVGALAVVGAVAYRLATRPRPQGPAVSPAGTVQTIRKEDRIAQAETKPPVSDHRAPTAPKKEAAPEGVPVVEPYPESPVEVAKAFFCEKLAGREAALAYAAKEVVHDVAEDMKRFASYQLSPSSRIKGPSWFLYARLASENPENDYFSRMARRTARLAAKIYPGKGQDGVCVALWYAFPSDQRGFIYMNTRACWVAKQDGRWKVFTENTWYYTIQVPETIQPKEAERRLLEQVRRTGITDYSAMGKAYYVPLPDELATIKPMVVQCLESWVRGDDAETLKWLWPESKAAMGGDLAKFTEAQKQQRQALAPKRLLDVKVWNESVSEPESPQEFGAIRQALQAILGRPPREGWPYCRVAIFDCTLSCDKGGKEQSVPVRIYAIKDDNKWLVANLPRNSEN